MEQRTDIICEYIRSQYKMCASNAGVWVDLIFYGSKVFNVCSLQLTKHRFNTSIWSLNKFKVKNHDIDRWFCKYSVQLSMGKDIRVELILKRKYIFIFLFIKCNVIGFELAWKKAGRYFINWLLAHGLTILGKYYAM